jgi:hypothetical protein
MLVYRTRTQTIETARLLDSIRNSPETTDLLVDLGVLESGVVDALNPDCDREHLISRAFRRASVLAGHLFNTGTGAARLATALERLASLTLPSRVEVTPPEGYAYYGLFPATYREAARGYFERIRPERTVVIGIRSIGTSLSGVVAAALEALGVEVYSLTVRPRGHPFQRELRLTAEFEQRLRVMADRHFLIVDEGPGLSGSSFASVAEKLSALGVSDSRIAFLPNRKPSGDEFVSHAAARRWRRHEKYAASFEEVMPFGDLPDLSAGKWRSAVYTDESEWPAVQPQHERRKYLRNGVLLKFAGLSSYGKSKLPRAEQLAEAGFSPRALGIENGFLMTEFVQGSPLSGRRNVTPELLETMARYLTFLRQSFPSARPVPFGDLLEMIHTNVGTPPDALERYRQAVCDSATVAIDGRMLPHEWLFTARGYLKTDSVDHHDDHFFPGCQDIAWDLAGASIEFELDAEQREHLLSRYQALSRDANLTERLPFYLIAYPAYRIGYVTLAKQALAGSVEARRFKALEQKYRAARGRPAH